LPVPVAAYVYCRLIFFGPTLIVICLGWGSGVRYVMAGGHRCHAPTLPAIVTCIGPVCATVGVPWPAAPTMPPPPTTLAPPSRRCSGASMCMPRALCCWAQPPARLLAGGHPGSRSCGMAPSTSSVMEMATSVGWRRTGAHALPAFQTGAADPHLVPWQSSSGRSGFYLAPPVLVDRCRARGADGRVCPVGIAGATTHAGCVPSVRWSYRRRRGQCRAVRADMARCCWQPRRPGPAAGRYCGGLPLRHGTHRSM
jgi:hypothetical protein